MIKMEDLNSILILAVAGVGVLGIVYVFHKVRQAENASRARFDELVEELYADPENTGTNKIGKMEKGELVLLYQQLDIYGGTYLTKKRMAQRDHLLQEIQDRLTPRILRELASADVRITPETRVEDLSATFRAAYRR